MTNERWKPVVGFENEYMVSDQGRVKSLDRSIGHRHVGHTRKIPGRTLNLYKDNKGYVYVVLSRHNKRYCRKVHQLVAAAFIGPCPEGLEVHHNKGIKDNNSVKNIKYVTHEENMRLAREDKLFRPTPHIGSKNGSAKLNENKVKRIKKLRLSGQSVKYLASKYGVTTPTIRYILKGHTWRHVS